LTNNSDNAFLLSEIGMQIESIGVAYYEESS